MACIELRDIHHYYGADPNSKGFAIPNLDITWEDGTANALLGPSGCGKTTLLNIISGLLNPRSGKVLIDGRDLTAEGPKNRHIAQVFQFPVVYDTMTVFDNLAFPLRNGNMPKPEVISRVHEVSEILELGDILKMPGGRLTAADKQKVCLGRGIVRKDISAVLLDEPLTVIDPKAKWDLRRKLRQVQEEFSLTMIYVTHDQHEALTFADHVTVMNEGQIAQTSSPHDLYDKPETPFVGYFIGSPGMNFLSGKIVDQELYVDTLAIPLSPETLSALERCSGELVAGIRPEYIALSKESDPKSLRCTLTSIEDTGPYKIVSLITADQPLKSRVDDSAIFQVGDTVWATFSSENVLLYKDGSRIHGGSAPA